MRKTLPRNNILIGDDKAQLRFFQQYTGLEVETCEKVTDDLLLGKEDLLLRVFASHRIDISPDVKAKTGIWSADPIQKGSSGANAIVRYAASILGIAKIAREDVDRVSAQITKDGIDDIRGAVWHAVWLLSGDNAAPAKWSDPWKDPINWVDTTDITHRLHSLYRSLVGWAFLKTEDLRGVRQFGISPSQQQFLKQQNLDHRRVAESIRVLSTWKTRHTDPFVCALRISSIWS